MIRYEWKKLLFKRRGLGLIAAFLAAQAILLLLIRPYDEVLERNRAAATRCRQKRKVWVMSLEKKAEELTQTNMQLQVQATVSFPGLKGPVYHWHFLARQALVDLSHRAAAGLLLRLD